MVTKFKHIKSTIKPSFSSQSNVQFNFSLKYKYYDYTHSPNSPSPVLINEETLETSVHHNQTLDESSSINTTETELDGALADHIRSTSVRNALVERALRLYRPLLGTVSRNGPRFKVDLDVGVEFIFNRVHFSPDDVGECRMVPADESSIRSLNKLEADCTEERSCSICLDEFVRGGEVAAMPCQHVFHSECIEKWLRSSHYCPICRFKMPVADA